MDRARRGSYPRRSPLHPFVGLRFLLLQGSGCIVRTTQVCLYFVTVIGTFASCWVGRIDAVTWNSDERWPVFFVSGAVLRAQESIDVSDLRSQSLNPS